MIDNFANGIDRYVEEALEDPDNKLSKEFHDNDMQPKRWSSIDVLRLYMASMTYFMDQEQELENENIYVELVELHGEEVAQAMFNDIIWMNDLEAQTSSESESSSGKSTPFGSVSVIESAGSTVKNVQQERDEFDQLSKKLGIPLKIGSNALVIGSSKSESGNPIMFGGPQVGFTAPGFIYEVGLHGPDLDIQGSAFIGYPFIMFGSTNEFSFTATAGFGDVVDIYKEELNPENSNEYKYNGEWGKLEKREEEFKVKKENGEIKTVTKEFFESVHGAVIFKDNDSNVAYSKKWAFRGTEADSWEAYLNMNWAKDLDGFKEAAQSYTMSLNWYYADVHGDIAYFYNGLYPVRDERIDWRFPTPGMGEYEWDGFKKMEDNPHEINPERGYVANWNNKPAPNWNNNERSFIWSSDSRVQQFMDGVEDRGKLSMEDINDINYHASFVDLKTRMFKPFLLEVISDSTKEDENYEKAYTLLDEWNDLREDKDEDGHYDSAAVLIMETWWKNFYENIIIEDDFRDLYDNIHTIIDHNYGSGLLYRLIQQGDASLEIEHDWLKGKTMEEVALESFQQTLEELEKEYGTSMEEWKVEIETMTFGEESLVGAPHGLGDTEPIISMNRGSENHLIEMKPTGPKGMNITPPGQIGFITKEGEHSQHYRNQIEMFKDFEYKPMLLDEKDVKESEVEAFEINFDE